MSCGSCCLVCSAHCQRGAQCSRHIKRFLKRVEEEEAISKANLTSHGLLNLKLEQKIMQLEQQLADLKSKL